MFILLLFITPYFAFHVTDAINFHNSIKYKEDTSANSHIYLLLS